MDGVCVMARVCACRACARGMRMDGAQRVGGGAHGPIHESQRGAATHPQRHVWARHVKNLLETKITFLDKTGLGGGQDTNEIAAIKDLCDWLCRHMGDQGFVINVSRSLAFLRARFLDFDQTIAEVLRDHKIWNDIEISKNMSRRS